MNGTTAVRKARLTTPEAAEYLGVPVRTLKDWRRDRVVTYIKIGKICLYNVRDLDALLEKYTVRGMGL